MSMNQRLMIPSRRGPWGPRSLPSLSVWLDASEASTVALRGASSVSAWRDRSAKGNSVFQAVASRQPEYAGDLNFTGKNAVAFDGSDDSLQTSASAPPTSLDSTALTWAVAFRSGANGVLLRTAYAAGTSSSGANQNMWGSLVINSEMISHVRTSGGVFAGVGGQYITADQPAIVVARWAGSTIQQWFNGLASVTNANADATPSGMIGLAVGSTWNQQSVLNGAVAELVVFSGELADADLRRLEGYLAHKWGTESSLPSDHPYKASAPK